MKKPRSKKYPEISSEFSTVQEAALANYQVSYTSPIALLFDAKNGLSADTALNFLNYSGFTYDEFQQVFKTTVKTIQNYANQGFKLDASLSEKLIKNIGLFKRGKDVFGSLKAFQHWLNTPAYGLGNQTPFSLMDTFTGLSLVEDELDRIAFGDLA